MPKIIGELDFEDNNNGIKITNGIDLELSVEEFTRFLDSLKRIFGFENKCGEIQKFEIVKK